MGRISIQLKHGERGNFPKKLGADKGMISNLLNTDKLGSFIRSDIPGIAY